MEIKVVRLLTGEQILGEVEENEEFYHISHPFQLQLRAVKAGGQVDIGMVPLIEVLSADKEIDVRKSAVAFTYKPDEEISLKFRSSISGIIQPNAGLITG